MTAKTLVLAAFIAIASITERAIAQPTPHHNAYRETGIDAQLSEEQLTAANTFVDATLELLTGNSTAEQILEKSQAASYQILVAKLKASGIQESDIRVQALLKSKMGVQKTPRSKSVLLLGLAGGIAVGIGLVILYRHLSEDPRITPLKDLMDEYATLRQLKIKSKKIGKPFSNAGIAYPDNHAEIHAMTKDLYTKMLAYFEYRGPGHSENVGDFFKTMHEAADKASIETARGCFPDHNSSIELPEHLNFFFRKRGANV